MMELKYPVIFHWKGNGWVVSKASTQVLRQKLPSRHWKIPGSGRSLLKIRNNSSFRRHAGCFLKIIWCSRYSLILHSIMQILPCSMQNRGTTNLCVKNPDCSTACPSIILPPTWESSPNLLAGLEKNHPDLNKCEWKWHSDAADLCFNNQNIL